MWNENIKTWVDDLHTTEDTQGDGQLADVFYLGELTIDEEPRREVRYCCLGKGSTLVPGIKQVWPDEDGEWSEGSVYFGDATASQLAPKEFIEWLGYDLSAESEPVATEYDVYIDFPIDLRVRSLTDRMAAVNGGDASADEDGEFMWRQMSCANLNDGGFTFKQIADLIKHFGLSDAVKPVI